MAILPSSTANVTAQSAPETPELTGELAGQRADDLAGADAIRRGTQRLLAQHNLPSIAEFCLPNGRRADLIAVAADGDITIIEIKSSRADFVCDRKWQDYLDYCDRYYFAVDAAFPLALLPDGPGLILADAYGGDIIREPARSKLSSARRKSLLIAIARTAATRHHGIIDPGIHLG